MDKKISNFVSAIGLIFELGLFALAIVSVVTANDIPESQKTFFIGGLIVGAMICVPVSAIVVYLLILNRANNCQPSESGPPPLYPNNSMER